MSVLFNMPWQQAFDSSGNTIAGAKLYFYQAGTSTPATVYADVGLGVPLSNPVIANGAGRFEPIYLDDGMYKAVLKTSEDVMIWTADNIQTTSENADVAVVTQAITQTSISAGYTEEEAQNPTNFVKSIYKYVNKSSWFVDEGNVDNVYVLTGLDDYTRLNDYFVGFDIWFVCNRPNTGAATVNAATLGAKNIIREDGTAVKEGDINGLVHLKYNGTSFVVKGTSLLQRGDQTIYDVKTFDESPLVPTLEEGDDSQKPVNSEYLKDTINNALKPDYESAVSITAGNYTPTVNGILYVVSRPGNNRTAVFVDGVLAVWTQGHSGSSHGQPVPAMTVFVGAGQKAQISGSTDSIQEITTYAFAKFVPYGNYPE